MNGIGHVDDGDGISGQQSENVALPQQRVCALAAPRRVDVDVNCDQSFLASGRHRKRCAVERSLPVCQRGTRRFGASDAADDAQGGGFVRPHERERGRELRRGSVGVETTCHADWRSTTVSAGWRRRA